MTERKISKWDLTAVLQEEATHIEMGLQRRELIPWGGKIVSGMKEVGNLAQVCSDKEHTPELYGKKLSFSAGGKRYTFELNPYSVGELHNLLTEYYAYLCNLRQQHEQLQKAVSNAVLLEPIYGFKYKDKPLIGREGVIIVNHTVPKVMEVVVMEDNSARYSCYERKKVKINPLPFVELLEACASEKYPWTETVLPIILVKFCTQDYVPRSSVKAC